AGILAGARDEPAVEREFADAKRFIRRRFAGGGAAANQRDDLDRVAARQRMTGMAGKRNHFAGHLDGDPAPVVTQLVEELSDGEGFRQRLGLPVKCYLDHLAPPATEIGRFDFVRLAYSLYDSRFWSR